jgi:hypothetical protein
MEWLNGLTVFRVVTDTPRQISYYVELIPSLQRLITTAICWFLTSFSPPTLPFFSKLSATDTFPLYHSPPATIALTTHSQSSNHSPSNLILSVTQRWHLWGALPTFFAPPHVSTNRVMPFLKEPAPSLFHLLLPILPSRHWLNPGLTVDHLHTATFLP